MDLSRLSAVRRVPVTQAASAALVGVLLAAVAHPLDLGAWVPGLPPLTVVALAGLAVAAWHARRPAPPWWWHAGAVALGPALGLAAALWLAPGGSPVARALALARDVASWAAALGTAEVRSGRLEFAVLVVALCWTLGYAGGWSALRWRKVWPVAAPGALVLGVTLANLHGEGVPALVLFLAAAVALAVHLGLVGRQLVWRQSGLAYEARLGAAHLALVLGLGAGIVWLSWSLPALHAAPIDGMAERARPWQERLERDVSRLFQGLPTRRTYATVVWGDETVLGGPPARRGQALFTVEASQPAYWRARVHDEYTGRGWRTSVVQVSPWPDAKVALEAAPAGRELVRADFRMLVATDTLLSPGVPVAFSLPALVLEDAPGEGDALHARVPSAPGLPATRLDLQYGAIGSVFSGDPRQLHTAGASYPAGVAQRYLQLPDSITYRVRIHAYLVTADAVTPYEKAAALERYLRTLPYDEGVPAPPPGRDAVDYFLFTLGRGYCDYYATAMVVLLRVLGVPARYVLGYTAGRLDEEQGVYEVSDLHYHSWVEVYFPGHGWVAFEPTPPGAPEFTNATLEQTPSTSQAGGGPSLEDLVLDDPVDPFLLEGEPSPPPSWGGGVPGAGLAALALAALLAGAAGYWWWRPSRLGHPAAWYARMVRLASLAGAPPQPHQTALEYADALAAVLPAHTAAIRHLAMSYVRATYGPGDPMDTGALADAARAWRRVRGALLRRLAVTVLRRLARR